MYAPHLIKNSTRAARDGDGDATCGGSGEAADAVEWANHPDGLSERVCDLLCLPDSAAACASARDPTVAREAALRDTLDDLTGLVKHVSATTHTTLETMMQMQQQQGCGNDDDSDGDF